MDTIHTDVNDTNLNREDAAAAILKRWETPNEASKDAKGAKEPNDETVIKTPVTTETEEDPDDEGSEDPSDDDTNDEEDKAPKLVAKAAGDDDEVTYSVDGVETKVSVKDLKRLAGQEAALTRKSQDVATKTKDAEDLRVHHITALNALVQKAEDAYRPFADLDMLVASREMSPEDFAAVRSEQSRTYAQYKFLTEELGGMVQQNAQVQTQAHAVAAGECIKALGDATTGIPGYDQKMYDSMCTYAISSGMKPEAIYRLTDPDAFKIINKAMAYDKIKTVATEKKATSAKTVLKSTSNSTTTKTTATSEKTANNKFKASGSRADAATLLLQRWKSAE